MTVIRTIKNIDDPTWTIFKNLAAKNKTKLGPFFKNIIKEYQKKKTTFWKEILSTEKILSDKEAEEMRTNTKKLRKEYGFRI